MKLPKLCGLGAALLLALSGLEIQAQAPVPPRSTGVRGDPVPAEVEALYARGVRWLVSHQMPDGSWEGGQQGAGVTGLCVLSILALGDDPNCGPYAATVRKGIDSILKKQDPKTGFLGGTMYHHGFGTLALAEAYGSLEDPRLGPALEKAVDLILASQAKNPTGAWRYDPAGQDADTTASGCCLMALYAARNAGIKVPQAAIDRALAYYGTCQSEDGGFGYTAPGDSNNPRCAIGVLVLAIGRQKDSDVYRKALSYLKANSSKPEQHYSNYYMPQALFQTDYPAWKEWNLKHIDTIRQQQAADGSWTSPEGAPFATATSLLSVALNYRYLPIYER
ncbi:MAG: hypothetical protein RL095_2267 [Verrucomicrobiota bacterium]|jgi:hypothetical protein